MSGLQQKHNLSDDELNRVKQALNSSLKQLKEPKLLIALCDFIANADVAPTLPNVEDF